MRHTPVVFEGLRSRLSFLPIGLDVVNEALAPDGKSVAVTAVAAAYPALAAIPDENGVIHACYTRSTGSIHVIDNSVTNCKSGETSLAS